MVADDPETFTNGYIDIYPSGKTQYSKQIPVGGQPTEIALGSVSLSCTLPTLDITITTAVHRSPGRA